MEARELNKVVAALEQQKGSRADVAALKFAGEVLGVTTVNAPVGSTLTTLGAWGQNGPLMQVENQLSTCPPLSAEQQKKASALLKEFGSAMPIVPRAFTVGREGKGVEASAMFAQELERMAISGACPGEHPMYSHQRVSRMNTLLQCAKTFDPKRDVKPLEKVIEKAKQCAGSNSAVG